MVSASPHAEPHATEVALLVAGVLLFSSVVAGRFSSRFGVPVVLLFVALGMLAGSEGLGGIGFEDYAATFRVGTLALVLILFDGGLRTPLATVRHALAPAAVLATVGVALTAGLLGAGAHALGFSWREGLLLGAIVSSTDAAAVFSVLRGGGVRLDHRVGALLEVESGLNDPTAVLLTVAFTESLARGTPVGPTLALLVVVQLALGAAVGAALGFASRALLVRLQLRATSLYPLLTASVALVAFGAASLAHGSGFLAVYVAGVVLGDGRLPYRSALLRVHDFVAWGGQIGMFLVLGLLAFPSRLVAVAPVGLALALGLAFVARPVSVALCLAPFRYRLREIVHVGWVGLRGAVPIVLAVIPVLAGAPGGERVFDVVFFVVLVSTVLQGGTARALTRRLGLGEDEAPAPPALIEIVSSRAMTEDVLSFLIAPASAVCGARIADVPFPDGSSVMLVVRGTNLLAPRGDTRLEAGDHVFVFVRSADAPEVRLLFGREADV